jgi:hypothetical protein
MCTTATDIDIIPTVTGGEGATLQCRHLYYSFRYKGSFLNNKSSISKPE